MTNLDFAAGKLMGEQDRADNKFPVYHLLQDRLVCVEYDYIRPVNLVSEQNMARGYMEGYKT